MNEPSSGAADRSAEPRVSPAIRQSDVPTEQLDLSGEPGDQSRQRTLQPYDPRPQEDKARRNIAYALIGLLFLVVFAIIGLVAMGGIVVSDIKEFSVIIGPLVALVSAATGFYYGNR